MGSDVPDLLGAHSGQDRHRAGGRVLARLLEHGHLQVVHWAGTVLRAGNAKDKAGLVAGLVAAYDADKA